MLDKLQEIINNYNNYQNQMMDPEISSDLEKMKNVGKKISDLEEIHHLAQKYILLDAQINEAQQMLKSQSDPEMIELAQMQLDEAKSQFPALEEQIKIALLPKDPNDDKNIFMEIRPAAGGDEAGLFANELLKAYLMYASKKGRKAEVIEQQLNDV
jgi:peptide chain release factor 1